MTEQINSFDKKIKIIKVFEGGGPEYPPYLLLKLKNDEAVKYKYDEELNLKDSIIIKGEDYKKKYSKIFQNVPSEFINGSGKNFSSPNDDSGLLFEIILNDNSTNRWGVFLGNFKYSSAIVDYTKNIKRLLN